MNEEQMILDNLPLIYKSIKKMRLRWQTEDEWQDYYDSGLIGLIKGIRTFDDAKGYALSTYLVPCIENEIKHYLSSKNALARQNINGRDISINEFLGDEENDEKLSILQDKRVSVEKEVIRNVQIEEIIHCLNKMENKKDVVVTKLYYGLDGFPEMNYREIGETLNVSGKCIEQRVKRAIRNIKKEIEGKNEKENNKKSK
jgi:RNA polymerase sigma factor (sigma-70 family)